MRMIRFAVLLVAGMGVAQTAQIPAALAQTQSAPSAAIDNVTVDAGFAIYRIRRIEVFGGTMSTTDLRQLFDTNDPKPLPDRLRTITADRISIPEVVAELTTGRPGQSVTYRNLVLSSVSAGRVAGAAAQGTSMALVDENGGNVSADFGAFAAHNVDLVLAGRIASSSRSGEEPKALLYESFSMDGGGLVAPKDNFEITFGPISGSNVKARPFSTPLSALPKRDGPVNVMTPEQKRITAGFAADLLDSFEIGNFEMRDIGFKGLNDAKPVNGRIDRMVLAGIGDAKVEEFSFAGFSTTTPEGIRVSLGNLAFRGFDMSATRNRLRIAASDLAQPLEDAKPRELMPNLREFSLAGFEYSGKASDGAVASGADGNNVRIGKIEMHGSELYEGMPTALTATMDGLSFDVSPTASDNNIRAIAGLGYSSVNIGSRMDMAWKQTAQELAVNEVSVAAGGMGTLKLKGTLTNVSKDLFAPEPAIVQAAALSALVKNVDLTVSDQGLLNRVIANEAKRSGRTPDAVRSEWVSAAAVGIPAALGDAPAGRTLGSAVSRFIAKPGTLHISANAPNGIGAAEFMLFSQDPTGFLKRIDVQASAE
ncbi:MAG: hypothetical protein JOZ16_18840 [Methylobacteriaceae bacterium]|nr:hypothetical protein [Methylobacteriaceae bacterium]